jgi:ribonucleoside-diphosphate reductase alpha chain
MHSKALAKRPLVLTENAKTVLTSRYLWKNEKGEIVETPEQMFRRVAEAVAAIEGSKRAEYSDRFYDLMVSRRFMPNSPTLMNAGRPNGQLSACFVLPIEDSLESIFTTLKHAAKIHQSGGGTGFSFSRLRPAGSIVKSSSGVASGPISFLKIYDTATETIKQGGTRRGANMAILRVDHPDIFEFIDCKRDQRSILNFNISVGATREFMTAVRENRAFWLRDPRTGAGIKEVNARDLLSRIVQAAWECGDPGMVFLDRINGVNPTPEEGPMESTNPCGEQPLLPFESCNLGSLNLGEYFSDTEGFLWEEFKKDIGLAVRFLDNVVDLNSYPIDECAKITLKNRKIGLGIMGFADLLLMMRIPYDSEEARAFGEKVMGFLDREAKSASARLATERGAFPNYERSMWKWLGYPPLRNATVTTVAPTGTISIIAGASSGIEPIFSGVFYRNVLSGKRLVEVHPAVERALKGRGLKLEEITDEKISEELGDAWSPAQKVSVEAHVKMQAVFQRFSDSAVSKTVNLPEGATTADIEKAYVQAYDLGCKGITVYRDKSRSAQVLEHAAGVQTTQASPETVAGEDYGKVCPSC